MKIACFYHCLFFTGIPPEFSPKAFRVVRSQMEDMEASGLLAAADHFVVGINGGKESTGWAGRCIPAKAHCVYHGLASRSENLTIVEIEKWLPGHKDWLVLYFHTKGVCRNDLGNPQGLGNKWRNCMMRHLIRNWRQCVADLAQLDAVGCHWIRGLDATQHYFAGNFFWAKASYLLTLPSIFAREQIKRMGIADVTSRYEAEVWIGNGPKLPRIKDYHPGFNNNCP